MGEDHDARKRSKKRRKGAATIDRELAAEGGKRNRSKKNRIRKICMGMCYQPPVVSRSLALYVAVHCVRCMQASLVH